MPELLEIPYVDLVSQHKEIKQELLAAVAAVIDGGQFILGPEVEELEERVAKLCDCKEAVAVHSGIDGLSLLLRAYDIGEGDEVITAPNSFIASASCIHLLGAKAVFADVLDDYNIDPVEVEKAVTNKTKAIIAVNLTGRPADYFALQTIAEEYGLYLIEDAAQSFLAKYHGLPCGSLGDAASFSLHPLKTFGACGDAGIVTTNDEALAKKLRLLRNLGLETRDNCVLWSSHSRLDSMQAAILLVKLRYVESWTKQRQAIAHIYQKLLKDIPELILPLDKAHEEAVYHTFIIRAQRRDALKAYLLAHGIQTNIHYPLPIHQQSVAKEECFGQFPKAEKQAKEILSLPIHNSLTIEDIHYIAQQINQFYRGEIL